MAKILVVDPARSIRNILKERLGYEGYEVDAVEDTLKAMDAYASIHYDLVICGQPDPPLRISCPWIRMSLDSSPESIKMAMEQGAVDFVAKPINMNQLLEAIRKGLDAGSPKPGAEPLAEAETPYVPVAAAARNLSMPAVRIIGDSEPVRRLRTIIDKVAQTSASVLIMGPNGSGKELVAKALHEKSSRCKFPFIEVNCAAIPSELIESELFGHEKGAFTSAVRQHKGKFEAAHGGTLFLDEIGDMSLAAQSKVLRVLQERKICRVGSSREILVDVRVIAATNKHVPTEIKLGNFREDLFHRLSVIVIKVPGLAARLDDIPMLTEHFLEEICEFYGMGLKSIDPRAVKELQKMNWTGNIRELRNVVERLVILSEGKTITPEEVLEYADGFE